MTLTEKVFNALDNVTPRMPREVALDLDEGVTAALVKIEDGEPSGFECLLNICQPFPDLYAVAQSCVSGRMLSVAL